MLVDEILVEIGEFGPYQIMLYILLGLVGVPTAWQNMGITFYGGAMDHWCKIPELEQLPYEQQKLIAIPLDEDDPSRYSRCQVYDLPYQNYTQDELLNWNRTDMIPEGTPERNCPSGWVYDRSMFTSSLVSQFDLVCGDAGKVSLIQTIYMLGFLVGCIVFGQISDKIGRHKALVIALIMEVVIATAVTFVPNYAAYVTLRFFVGAAAAGGFTTIFVMCMEIIGPKHRLWTGVMVQGWFALGFMTIPGISYAIRDHGKLQLVCGLSPIVLWALFGLADESPRWLVTEGYDERATKVLAKIARVNGKKLPEKLNLEDNRPYNDNEQSQKKANFTDLFKTRGLCKVTINMWFNWFVTSMVYYGLSLGVDMLPGSIFLNSFLSAVIEIPAYVVAIFALQYMGRRWPNCITLVLGGVCCLLCMAFIQREDLQQGATAFLLIGKFFTSATFAIVYVYAAELFPTVIRQVGVGSSSMCARVGSLIQPQIQRLENLWSPGTFLVYGVLSIIGGILTLFLPETLGKTLPDTVEEGEEFARDAKFTLKLPNRHPEEKSKMEDISKGAVVNEGFQPDNVTTTNGFVTGNKEKELEAAHYGTYKRENPQYGDYNPNTGSNESSRL